MSNYVRYCITAGCFAAIGIFFLSGCQESGKSESGPAGQNGTVVLDCIAEYHNPDGSRYVSEQSHKIEFDEKILRIKANEPAGEFEWLLEDGIFTISQNSAVPAIPSTLCDENVAKGLLGLYIANVNNMGLSLSASGEPTKIEGRRYQMLAGSDDVTFCKNLDTSIIDTVLLAGADKRLMVRGHGYKELKTVSGSIPTKIEIFKSGAEGSELKLLVRYNGVIWE